MKIFLGSLASAAAAWLTYCLVFGLVASCSPIIKAPYRPRPPRGKYSLEQAQRWNRKMSTPKFQNRKYYPVRPR